MTPTTAAADEILLLYSLGAGPDPTTVTDSIRCFARHSAFRVWPLNAHYGLPLALRGTSPSIIVLHYTMFYDRFGRLERRYREFLDRRRDSHLVAMFQDEQADLEQCLRFCREFDVDVVYTMFGPEEAQKLYGERTPATQVRSHIPGYVSDQLPALGNELMIADPDRSIDVGYRGRRPPAQWGAAALEKYEIGVRFAEHAHDSGLRLDIASDEASRIYGRDWYRFIADCRATLGTESGTEIAFEGETLPYRTISPRHLEAAALRSCQILYEGRYSGLLEPMVHYIPLRKDFSNFAEVVDRLGSAELRQELTGNARRDLIDSGRLSYATFVAEFDRLLIEAGYQPQDRPRPRARMELAIRQPSPRRLRVALAKAVRRMGLR